MANLKIPPTTRSFIETDVEPLYADPKAYGLTEDELFACSLLMKYVDMERGVLKEPLELERGFLWRVLMDYSNHADQIAYDKYSPKEDRAFYRNVSKGFSTLATKVSHPGLTANKRPSGGKKAAETRSQKRGQFLTEVEYQEPGLLLLAKKWEHKIPVKPPNQSRFEYFMQMVESDPDASIQVIDEETEKYVKQLAREWRQMGEEEEDSYEFVDDFHDEEQPLEIPEDVDAFVSYLEGILSDREIQMINRIVAKEGVSDREMTCFFRQARKKLKRNGSIWK